LDLLSSVAGRLSCRKEIDRRDFATPTNMDFSVFSFVLYDGGTALLFWGFIAIGLGMMLVYASLAELASM